ncbi:patatin-like phospholipase family protein [Hymenobacter sp. GOD-10R]|uniref:patatin-like phospholipase family protein n=1 Tax=Hymenobacter sp. GOD-10R TaxID=3093922 RepID=UPI002D79CEE1|nr:patatin-like phospholipase family protein [Hymenobacter sp. GOD-10R]WRQ27674.1 patatin-like phospholipase family protein [Hymenobacter sp. GOD-10R]
MAKTALVISGGGSKGAFAVGVLQYIQQHVQPLTSFTLYGGTSTGSLIAPLAACGELALLERLYTTLRQQDLVKLGGIANLVTGISVHDATPLKQQLDTVITPAHYERLRAIPIFLATVCLQTQRLVYWSTQTVASTAHYDVEQIRSVTDLRRAMLASCCQPVLLQPVEVRPGAVPIRQYVDGGVREATPLQAVVDQGAETIIAITLNPYQTPADNTPKTKAIQVLERTIDLFSEDVGANDYRVAELYAQGNQYLQAIRRALLARGVAAGIIEQALAQPSNPFAGTAVTTIHEIRPQTKLEEGGPGGLTFQPAAMQGMLRKGYAQAEAYFTAHPNALGGKTPA